MISPSALVFDCSSRFRNRLCALAFLPDDRRARRARGSFHFARLHARMAATVNKEGRRQGREARVDPSRDRRLAHFRRDRVTRRSADPVTALTALSTLGCRLFAGQHFRLGSACRKWDRYRGAATRSVCDVQRSPARRMTGVHRFALGGKIIATLAGNVTDGQKRALAIGDDYWVWHVYPLPWIGYGMRWPRSPTVRPRPIVRVSRSE